MTLNQDERRLILKLIEDPLISISQLTQELSRSRPTVISQLKRLRQKYNVQAIFKLHILGLKNSNFFLECKSENIPILEKIIDEFPYSQYRARIIGPKKGFFSQFHLPKSLSLDDFLSMLKNNEIIESHDEVSPQSPVIRTNFSLRNYERERNDFNFDWEVFKKSIAKPESKYPIDAPNSSDNPLYDEFEPVDMFILATMSEDARKRGSDLLSPLGETYSSEIPPYVISRRFKFIKNKLINSYKVQLVWELFNIYNASIFVSRGPFEKEKINSLAKQIQDKFPFDSLFYLINGVNGFFWFIASPPSHFPSITSLIWEFTKDNFDYYYLDYQTSKRYLFYDHHNFGFGLRQWKTDESYLLDQIKEILNKRT